MRYSSTKHVCVAPAKPPPLCSQQRNPVNVTEDCWWFIFKHNLLHFQPAKSKYETISGSHCRPIREEKWRKHGARDWPGQFIRGAVLSLEREQRMPRGLFTSGAIIAELWMGPTANYGF